MVCVVIFIGFEGLGFKGSGGCFSDDDCLR